jgi:hypothetical protein
MAPLDSQERPWSSSSSCCNGGCADLRGAVHRVMGATHHRPTHCSCLRSCAMHYCDVVAVFSMQCGHAILVVRLPQVLGRVNPGGILPLPQGWRIDNKQLQLRPVLALPSGQDGAQPSAPSHAWSYGVANGQHSISLASMEDGASRLLCCRALGVPEARSEDAADARDGRCMLSPRKAAAAAPSMWFSTTCDANELVLQGGMDVLTGTSAHAAARIVQHSSGPAALALHHPPCWPTCAG